MKQAVFKVEVHDDKEKQKVLKTIAGLAGVDSFSIDMKDKKLKVVGDIDPVSIASKLKRLCHTTVVFVGRATAKEPQHKEEAKKDDKKKDEPKKDDVAELLKAYQAYNPHTTTHYHVRSAEEDPNACVMKDKKLKVVGDIDPASIVKKLRKLCHTEVVSVGPAKEPQQKDGEGEKMKAVFKVEVHDDKGKQKVLKTISGLAGVDSDSVSIDMKDKKLKVVGDIDPVSIVKKLRKLCHTELVSVGPAKEPQQKDGEGEKKDDGEGKKKPQQKDGEGKEG